MHDDLRTLCATEFADHVDALFEKDCATIKNAGVNVIYLVLQAPYIEFIYSALDDAIVPELKDLVCAALAARERYRRSKPAWAKDLPLSIDACEMMEGSSCPRVQAVGR